MSDKDMLARILRHDLLAFIQRTFQTVSPGPVYQANWHIEAIAWHLRRCFRREIKRLIITLPPRSLKSICCSVAYPAWLLGHDPTLRILCASYSNELSVKFARDCRAVMESDWYRAVFHRTQLASNAELELTTKAHGFRLGTSVGGTLTGRGGNFIILDDPMKPSEAMSDARRAAAKDWYDSTLFSRLDSKKDDVIILVMQRLHVDDLVAHLLGKDGAEEWVVLNLPAIAEITHSIEIGDGLVHHRPVGDVLHPEREPLETLERIKETVGSYFFAAQYQQSPVPADGGMIPWRWFKLYREPPQRERNDLVMQRWDTASKAEEINDYSVGTWLVKRDDLYLIDLVRGRLQYPELKRRITEAYAFHWPTALLIEDKGSGTSLIQDLRCDGLVRPIAFEPERDKITRMSTQSAKIEAGHVHVPEQAPWLDEFRMEMMQFPYGRHDDQVDSVSQFLTWIEQRRHRATRWIYLPHMQR